MKQETRRAPAAQHHPEPSSFGSLILGWAQQGFESFLATQRILMDFATRKGTGAMKTLREGMWDPEHSPVAILTELAVEATANLTEAQRIMLNLVQQENDIIMAGVKDRVSGSETAANMTDRVRRGIDTLIEMQQDLLTTVSKHAQKRFVATKDGKGFDATCMVDMAREAMDDFVRAQKRFLDVFAEEGKHKMAEKDGHKKAELSKLAREAANAFIDAQKKLLDLAGQQVNVNLQAATRTVEMVNALRPRLMPNISGEGIKSFMQTEKDLITHMGKETTKAAKKVVAPKPRKRPVARRRRTAPTVQAAHVGV